MIIIRSLEVVFNKISYLHQIKKKPNTLTKFLAPQIYAGYHTLLSLVPQGLREIKFAPEVERIRTPRDILFTKRKSLHEFGPTRMLASLDCLL